MYDQRLLSLNWCVTFGLVVITGSVAIKLVNLIAETVDLMSTENCVL